MNQLTRDIVTSTPLVLSISVRSSSIIHTTCLHFSLFICGCSITSEKARWNFPLGFHWQSYETDINRTLMLIWGPIDSHRQHVWGHSGTAARTLKMGSGVCGYGWELWMCVVNAGADRWWEWVSTWMCGRSSVTVWSCGWEKWKQR